MTPGDKRLLFIVAGVALVAGVGVLLMSGKAPPAFSSIIGLGRRVYHRQRAAGVDRRLQAFLDWWEKNGPFPIVVDPDGGVRTDAAKQRAFYDKGASEAATLDLTPHGRAGAIDVHPVKSGNPVTGAVFVVGYHMAAEYAEIGRVAESMGLKWGGRWKTPKMPDGDAPHIEVPDWKSLPFPPAANGGVAVA